MKWLKLECQLFQLSQAIKTIEIVDYNLVYLQTKVLLLVLLEEVKEAKCKLRLRITVICLLIKIANHLEEKYEDLQ